MDVSERESLHRGRERGGEGMACHLHVADNLTLDGLDLGPYIASAELGEDLTAGTNLEAALARALEL